MNADPADRGPEATRASHYQLSYPLHSKEVRDKNLGQPAYRTPKGERDQSMSVKREQARSASYYAGKKDDQISCTSGVLDIRMEEVIPNALRQVE